MQGSPYLQGPSRLEGSGWIQGDVINAGQILPHGLLTIEGSLTQAEEGRLAIGIGGRIPGQDYDVLQVTGTVTLDGTFASSTRNGFAAQDGDSFRVMSFASRNGDFATYTGLDLGGGVAANPELTQFDLSLVVGFSSGPAILQVIPSTDDPAVDEPWIEVVFDEPVDPATFTTADMQLLGPVRTRQLSWPSKPVDAFLTPTGCLCIPINLSMAITS